MSITLHYHPYSRAANVVWMLEELQLPYELAFVDIMKGAQKTPELLARNPMGKLPVLEDGATVIAESAAIGLYLADRYALGSLAPALDDPRRGTYLRWALFAPSVIEPACAAKMFKWESKPSSVGWGSYEDVVSAVHAALGERDYLLDEFSMADVIFGGTLRYMLTFKMMEPSPTLLAYTERLSARPAAVRADAKNAELAAQFGLT